MILALGNPVYDLITTPKLRTSTRVLSGCSTNAALMLARLGERVHLVGSLADDFRGHFERYLGREGIGHSLLDAPATGGFALKYLDDEGNRDLNLIDRAADIGSVDPALVAEARAIIIGPILGELSFELIKQLRLRTAAPIMCDPQGLLRNADSHGRISHHRPDGIESVFAACTIVKPNELEGRILTDIDCRYDPFSAARLIHGWGPKVVIVTLAELGSLVYDGTTFYEIPAFAVDLVDATGAGDTYMAGFLFEYLQSGDLRRAGCCGAATASVMVSHSGPDFAVTLAEIARRQEALLAQTGFHLPVDRRP